MCSSDLQSLIDLLVGAKQTIYWLFPMIWCLIIVRKIFYA